eukprot:scaffold7375_cov98-Skeletonema_marinoi.AAC.3
MSGLWHNFCSGWWERSRAMMMSHKCINMHREESRIERSGEVPPMKTPTITLPLYPHRGPDQGRAVILIAASLHLSMVSSILLILIPLITWRKYYYHQKVYNLNSLTEHKIT